MEKIQCLEMLTSVARKYRLAAANSIKRNGHMNEATEIAIDQRDIDALLTDFINTVGMHFGVDYALYASDLAKNDSAPVA